MRVYANAKINLGLDVTGKRNDGYHEVSMIMQEVTLCDIIDIVADKSSNISLQIKNSNLPCDESNIAWKAAKLFFEKTGIDGGCDMVLEKHIPVCAGLGGGSADAAAVLKALNEIYNYPLCEDELLKLGLLLGADVPFCIMGKTAHALGIGEILSKIESKLDKWVVLIKPDINISTPLAYKAIDSVGFEHPNIEKAINAIEKGDADALRTSTGNAFEYVCCPLHSEIDAIKKHLLENGAVFSMMSGSGPTVFGLFDTKSEAEIAFKLYNGSYQGGGVCRFVI